MPVALLLAAALVVAAPRGPTVHVMLHVPHRTIAHTAAYTRDLQRYGRAIAHAGTGTWVDPKRPGALEHERVDHLEVVTELRTARSFLPAFLRVLRSAESQHETLGEIFGGAYGTPAQTRVRIVVRLPAFFAREERLERLHRIFADSGAGGDSTYAEGRIVVDYSGVKPDAAGRIKAQLRNAGFPFSTEPETFVTDTARTR